MKHIVTVNQHVIAANKKKMEEGVFAPDPPFSCREGRNGKPTYAYTVDFPDGARLVYEPGNPLKCGATVWMEAKTVVIGI